jgi:hypothetical protein
VIRAEVIGLGAKMAESAPAGFLKWARSYAKREILGRPAPPEDEAVQKTFGERFPKAAPSARAAGVFLLWYEAYQQVSEDQQFLGERVSDMNRDISHLESDLVRLRTTTPSLADPARNAQARLERRLEDARRQRGFYRRGLDALNPRMDVCLRRLATLHETIKDSDPAEIRGLK